MNLVRTVEEKRVPLSVKLFWGNKKLQCAWASILFPSIGSLRPTSAFFETEYAFKGFSETENETEMTELLISDSNVNLDENYFEGSNGESF